MKDSLPKRWHNRIEAEFDVAIAESEAIFVASGTIEATLTGLSADVPGDRIREIASSLRTSAQQVAESALRVTLVAECLLLLADLAREASRDE